MTDSNKQQIQVIENKIKELKQEVEKLKNDNSARWRAQFKEEYWFMDASGDVVSILEDEDRMDDFLYSIGNYFKTEKEAEKYKQHLIITQKLKDIALRLNSKILIDKKDYAYEIYLDPISNTLYQKFTQFITGGAIYCFSDEFLKTAIKEIGEQELINYIKEN